MNGAQIKVVIAILKKRFPNLTTEETVDLAVAIVEAVVEMGR